MINIPGRKPPTNAYEYEWTQWCISAYNPTTSNGVYQHTTNNIYLRRQQLCLTLRTPSPTGQYYSATSMANSHLATDNYFHVSIHNSIIFIFIYKFYHLNNVRKITTNKLGSLGLGLEHLEKLHKMVAQDQLRLSEALFAGANSNVVTQKVLRLQFAYGSIERTAVFKILGNI